MLEETKYSAEVCYMDEDKNEVEQCTDLMQRTKTDGNPVFRGNPSNFKEKI